MLARIWSTPPKDAGKSQLYEVWALPIARALLQGDRLPTDGQCAHKLVKDQIRRFPESCFGPSDVHQYRCNNPTECSGDNELI